MKQGGKIVLDDGTEFSLTHNQLRFICLGHMTAHSISHDTFQIVAPEILPRLDDCHEKMGNAECRSLAETIKGLMYAQLTPEQREEAKKFEEGLANGPTVSFIEVSGPGDLERALSELFRGLSR